VAALHALTIADILREKSRSFPLQTAAVCGDMRIPYRELDRRVNQVARWLASEGVDEGARVAWLGQNCHRMLEVLLACAKLGAIMCPANWRLSAPELRVMMNDLRPQVAIWQRADLAEWVEPARDAGCPTWICHDETGPDGFDSVVDAKSDAEIDVIVDPAAALLLLYTATVGGTPKGALLSHQALIMQAAMVTSAQRVDHTDVYLASGAMYHIAAWMTSLAAFAAGGTNVYLPRVDADEVCTVIEKERVTRAFLLDATRAQIVERNRELQRDLSSLKAGVHEGTREWRAIVGSDDSAWGRRPAGYGQTQVSGLATFNGIGPDAVGSNGRPGMFVQVRIVTVGGEDAAAGEPGRIVVRGPTVMVGWHGEDALTDDWWQTGDIGRREVDGSITFLGTAAPMIKSGLENVYPAEVEAVLRAHPAVRECVVIGTPDPRWTQVVKAIVVLGADAPDTDELIEHCSNRLAPYKRPRSVVVVDELPKKDGALDLTQVNHDHGGGGYPGSGF
jgi:acyl-CoA synthetase (AMP-forming)/AMP-acid ligase II